jgi:hypothetical protein
MIGEPIPEATLFCPGGEPMVQPHESTARGGIGMDTRQQLIFPGVTSQRRLPVNYDNADAGLFEPDLTYVCPDTVLKVLRRVTIVPPQFLFQGARLLKDTYPEHVATYRMKSPKRAAREYLRRSIAKAQLALLGRTFTIVEPVYWITDTWSNGYFHWLCDAVPRLYAAWRNDKDMTLLLPATHQWLPFVGDSLGPFNLKRIRYVSGDCLTRCTLLNMPTLTSATGNYNDKLIGEIRQLFGDHFAAGRSRKPMRRIFVSRAQASRRRVANETEIVPVLDRYGFELVYTEKMTFPEQVRLFGEADVLVSVNGAGMTNMLFMERSGLVVEMRNRAAPRNNAFFALATTCGQRYAYLQCSPADATDRGSSPHADVICSPVELDRLLGRLL